MTLLIALSLAGATVPEENYDFLSVLDGPCVPKLGYEPDPKDDAKCGKRTGPRHYRGTWYASFETSSFTPVGKPRCLEGVTKQYCTGAMLVGDPLPRPGRWACAREFEIEFIGRRNIQPGWFDGSLYEIVVDKLISAKRLPDPPHESDECDPKAP